MGELGHDPDDFDPVVDDAPTTPPKRRVKMPSQEQKKVTLTVRAHRRLEKWARAQNVGMAEAVAILLDRAGAPLEPIEPCTGKVPGCKLIEFHRGDCQP